MLLLTLMPLLLLMSMLPLVLLLLSLLLLMFLFVGTLKLKILRGDLLVQAVWFLRFPRHSPIFSFFVSLISYSLYVVANGINK